MNPREEAKRRVEILKNLRMEHQETVSETQALLRAQKQIQQQICQVIRDTAHTVPEVAAATGLPSSDVLWHLTCMKKYGQVVETGMCGDYYLYQKAQEINS